VETNLEQTRRFHEATGIPVATRPGLVHPVRLELRMRLIQEETIELLEAMLTGPLEAIAKEMADVLTVVYGTALEYGIPLDAVYTAVNDSNIAKAGGPLRGDGKLLKPPGWKPPDLSEILKEGT
jgi:predicted HAD superfamily Cof-like phosphohydrolase